jgi:hypothetical protein
MYQRRRLRQRKKSIANRVFNNLVAPIFRAVQRERLWERCE